MSVDAVLAPVDWVRREVFRGVAAAVGPKLADRELRVGAMAMLSVLSSLALTVVFPIWALALGPILLGVPHLLSDVRYLVVRRGLHRRLEAQLAIGLPLLAVTVWPHVWVGLAAAAGGFMAARADWRLKAAGLTAVASLGVVAHTWVRLADVAFAHVHNLVAVGLLLAWRGGLRQAGWPRVAVVALFAAVGLLLLGGGFDSVTRWAAPWNSADLGLTPFLQWIAPGGSGIDFHWVLFFAFAQSMHYAIWLRLIPELDRPRPAPRPFRASLASVRADFGDAWLGVFAVLFVALAGWALFRIGAARDGYLGLAVFHGHLELGALALLWAERRPLWAPA